MASYGSREAAGPAPGALPGAPPAAVVQTFNRAGGALRGPARTFRLHPHTRPLGTPL